MTNQTAIIYSKDNCPHCVSALALLTAKGIKTEVLKVGADVTREQLLERVPTARSVPQIFINEKYIGGFDKLQEWFKTND